MKYHIKAITLVRVKDGKKHITHLKGSVRFHIDLIQKLFDKLDHWEIHYDPDTLINSATSIDI